MRRSNIYIISAILLLIAAFAAYHYIFSIYEVIFSVHPKELYADNQSTVTISVVPLNAFGWEAPLRNSPAKFEITEGTDLVEIFSLDEKNGIMILKAKNKTGRVAVLIKSKNALLPSAVEIEILPNVASL